MTNDIWAEIGPTLERPGSSFPYEAVKLALEHREAVAPRLADVLSRTAAEASSADDDNTLLLFAIYFALCRSSDHDRIEYLFGDHLTESVGRALASVCEGNLEPIVALCEDREAYAWARVGGFTGLMACVVEGCVQRDIVVAHLERMARVEANVLRMDQAQTFPGSAVLDHIVGLLSDLGAKHLLPEIRQWFAEGLLDPTYADLDLIQSRMAKPLEEVLAESRKRREGLLLDPETEMSWWHSFRGDDEERDDSLPADEWAAAAPPYVRKTPKIGRNDPCPCGSGKKYKKCHGAS